VTTCCRIDTRLLLGRRLLDQYRDGRHRCGEGKKGFCADPLGQPSLPDSTIVLMSFAIVGVRVGFSFPISRQANWTFHVNHDARGFGVYGRYPTGAFADRRRSSLPGIGDLRRAVRAALLH